MQMKTFNYWRGGGTCHCTRHYGQEADIVFPMHLCRSDYDIGVSEL